MGNKYYKKTKRSFCKAFPKSFCRRKRKKAWGRYKNLKKKKKGKKASVSSK